MYTPDLTHYLSKAGERDTDKATFTAPLCFQEAAEALSKNQITAGEYFQHHLAHIVLYGVRHESDESDVYLTSLITTNPVAGAFKMWFLDSNFPAADEKG
jgi:hypothetical protein